MKVFILMAVHNDGTTLKRGCFTDPRSAMMGTDGELYWSEFTATFKQGERNVVRTCYRAVDADNRIRFIIVPEYIHL